MTSLHDQISKILDDEHRKIKKEKEIKCEDNIGWRDIKFVEITVSYAQSHFQEIYS